MAIAHLYNDRKLKNQIVAFVHKNSGSKEDGREQEKRKGLEGSEEGGRKWLHESMKRHRRKVVMKV